MLYHADFHIEYPSSMSQKDFFSISAREAEAALGAKKAGIVIDIWKVVAETKRTVVPRSYWTCFSRCAELAHCNTTHQARIGRTHRGTRSQRMG